MNKLLGKLLALLSWVWLVASAALLYRAVLSPESAMPVIKSPALLGLLSGLLFVIAFLVPVNRILRAKKRKEIHYANAIGEISISLSAIEEALERVLDDIDIVRSYEVSLFDNPADKKLNVKARLSLWEVNDIPTKIAEIQQELKSRFEEIMPEAESVEYKVTLSNFMPKSKSKNKKDKDEPAEERDSTEETDYFTGIKYPVPAEEEEE